MHDRLVIAERHLRERDKELAAALASNQEREAQIAELAKIREHHEKGNRFHSSVIIPAHLSESDWPQLSRYYDDEAEFKKWVQMVMPYTMVTYDGLISLADQVRYCEEHDLPGSYVEAGTWKGGSAAMMAFANLRYGKGRRRIYLFDSFQGIPEPDADKDDISWIRDDMKLAPDACQGRLRSIDRLVGPREAVEDVFFNVARYPRDSVNIVPGWFQETVPLTVAEMGPIAILRLDGDLYDSIRVCLEHMYPLLVEGGFLIIDDWCLSGARKAVIEYFAKQPSQPYMCYADGTVRYFIKP